MSKNTLIKNSVTGVIQFVLTAILTLVSVPIFIHKLGLELYGIFALVSVIGNLNMLSNFGLNSSLLVYVAQQGKSKESNYDIVVTQILMIGITTIFTILVIIFKEQIVSDLFSVPEQYSNQAGLLLVYLSIANSLLLIGQINTAIIDALQMIYLSNISQFFYGIIYWGGIIIIVTLGGDLADVGFVALCAAMIWAIIVFMISRYLWGKMEIKGLKNEFKRVVVKQIAYGSKIYFSGLVGFLFEPLSKILLSNFIGLNAVAFFEIGSRIKGQINGILTKIIYPFLPFIANRPINIELKRKVFDLSKKIQLIVLPISIIAGFSLSILVKLWIGEHNYFISSVFVITMSTTVLIFSVPILPIYQYLAAKNLGDKNIWIQLSSVVVNIIIFFALYKVIGLYSILISNTLAFLASYSLGNYYQGKYLDIIFRNEMLFYFQIFIYALFCTAGCLIIRYLIPVGLWDLLIYPIIVIASFIFYVRKMELITKLDLELYFETLPYVKRNLNRILVA